MLFTENKIWLKAKTEIIIRKITKYKINVSFSGLGERAVFKMTPLFSNDIGNKWVPFYSLRPYLLLRMPVQESCKNNAEHYLKVRGKWYGMGFSGHRAFRDGNILD